MAISLALSSQLSQRVKSSENTKPTASYFNFVVIDTTLPWKPILGPEFASSEIKTINFEDESLSRFLLSESDGTGGPIIVTLKNGRLILIKANGE